jgi:hypothetical protein
MLAIRGFVSPAHADPFADPNPSGTVSATIGVDWSIFDIRSNASPSAQRRKNTVIPYR